MYSNRVQWFAPRATTNEPFVIYTSSHRFVRRSTLQVEQKRIFLNLRENGRGRYLRIVEVPTKGIVLYGKLVSN